MFTSVCVLAVLTAAAPVLRAEPDSRSARVHDDGLQMEVAALNEDVLRVRITPRDKTAEDASWVVSTELRARTLNI